MAFLSIVLACLALFSGASSATELYNAVRIQLEPPTSFTSAADLAKLKPKNVYVEPLGDVANFSTKVVGGQEATPHAYKYQVATIIDGSSFCGGSLISTKYVLCAAHCALGATSIEIILGAHNIKQNETTQVSIIASAAIIHMSYNFVTLANDISLIELSEEVALNGAIDVVPLAPASSGTYEGDTGLLTGWGRTLDSDSSISPVLRWINLPIISNTECRSIQGPMVTSGNICTSGSGRVGACFGDSGGPLVSSGVQVGIVSFGSSRCEAGDPTAFTRVSYFRDWISWNSGV